jgi:hypothetical protein
VVNLTIPLYHRHVPFRASGASDVATIFTVGTRMPVPTLLVSNASFGLVSQSRDSVGRPAPTCALLATGDASLVGAMVQRLTGAGWQVEHHSMGAECCSIGHCSMGAEHCSMGALPASPVSADRAGASGNTPRLGASILRAQFTSSGVGTAAVPGCPSAGEPLRWSHHAFHNVGDRSIPWASAVSGP